MDSVVLDANIIIKWFVNESDSHLALIIREKFINNELEIIIPQLLFYEVLNGLKYTNLFSKEELNTVVDSLLNYGFKIINLNDKMWKSAINLAMDHDITIYDAAYIAIAIENQTQLYTADMKIQKKLPNNLKKYILNISEIKF